MYESVIDFRVVFSNARVTIEDGYGDGVRITKYIHADEIIYSVIDNTTQKILATWSEPL